MTKIDKLLRPWPIRFFLRKISMSIIVVTLCLSLSVIGLTIYMDNVGNFVIAIEKDERKSLALSEDGIFGDEGAAILFAEGLTNATNVTYSYIQENLDEIRDTNGSHNDPAKGYTAYTFYLKNESDTDISYLTEFRINQMYKAVDAAIRIQIYIDDGAESSTIYAKPNADGTTYVLGEDPNGRGEVKIRKENQYTTTPFKDSTTVCEYATAVFKGQEIKKYTVCMWLEGWDPECVDDIKGGAIRMTMAFSILG